MSFEGTLKKIVSGCGGGIGIALMESDGIPIVQVRNEVESESPLGEDLSVAGAEFGRILGEVRKASDSLGGGAVTETVIHLARLTLIFRNIDEDIVLVLALQPDGNLGKARYLIRRYLLDIREQL
jgi:predicted regulator of Ras-like GTPase activity (Roadblock/LC7/MglB family)